MAEPSTITLVISRSTNGAEQRKSRFSVPVSGKHIRVLDALLYARQHEDPTLGFRYACRVGMCGSCAMVINGKERLACQTAIGSLGTTTIRVEPLRGLPVKRDVMIDMAPFFDSLARADAALNPAQPTLREIRTIPPDDPERKIIEGQNGCITCGACFSACEWSSTHPSYLGPAALNRLLMLALDQRDARGRERLKTAACDAGALRCHSLGSCGAVCPVEVPLRTGMQRLKGLIARMG